MYFELKFIGSLFSVLLKKVADGVFIFLNNEPSFQFQCRGYLSAFHCPLCIEKLVTLNFFRFTKPEINLNMSQSFYYSLSQSGRFRDDGETTLSWEIIDDLKLDMTFYNNYDSKPPVATNRKFDYGIVFGVSYSF